jgi:hypothetical protein
MRVAEAKRRRLLRLAGAMALMLAPRGVGVAAVERTELPGPPPRPGSIPVPIALPPTQTPLEMEAPELVGLALRTHVVGSWERPLSPARAHAPAEPDALPDLVPLDAPTLAAEPVAEPPAALLLAVAGGAWLAARRSRQPPKRGGRFSRNASMPSMASASSRLSAITAPASR